MTFDRPESDSGEKRKTNASNAPSDSVSLSEMMEILSRRLERRILVTLLHEDKSVSIESMAGAVAARNFSPLVDMEQRSDSETAGS